MTSGESEIAFESSGGRRKTSLAEVIERFGTELPQCVIVPAVEVPFESSHRKCIKAQEKTLAWFKQCHTASSSWEQEVSLFGVAIPHAFRPHQMPLDADKELSATLVSEHVSYAYGLFAKKLVDYGATGTYYSVISYSFLYIFL